MVLKSILRVERRFFGSFDKIRYSEFLYLDEIFQDEQADIAGLFGVKLCRENIFKLNRRRDFFAVSGRSRDYTFIVGTCVVAVHEIKIRIIFYPLKQITHYALRITN